MGAATLTPPLALLRAPPFPGADACVTLASLSAGESGGLAPFEPDLPSCATLFDAVRRARVGGDFWAPPAPEILHARVLERTTAQACRAMNRFDPWSLFAQAEALRAHGDDEWVALARIAGLRVEVLSPGRYGAPGDDAITLDARIYAELTGAAYRDPFRDGPATIRATIALLADWRRTLEGNLGIVAASGMAWWKRAEIRRFLWSPQQRLALTRRPAAALARARKVGGSLAIWPSRVTGELLDAAREAGVGVVRVEDGFVRSVGLGSNLVPPSSIVVDHAGIHFDPSGPSDLEILLAGTVFDAGLVERAAALRATIVAAGISKYAAGTAQDVSPRAPGGRRRVLVPGQVEDDMSVLAGGGGLASNLELLRRARAREPDAEIWWRPHPDVDAGHRKGAVADEEALQVADRIVRGGPMAPLLEAVDAVHVLTSLTGFEALLRGCEVTCHGTPFYAGWGLTRDLGAIPSRRGRTLSLDELVAGVLILYPRYLDPVTGLPCPPEVLVARMVENRAANRLGWIEPLRRAQGRLMSWLR